MILTFHRVPAETDELLPDEPPAAVFERQMTWLREYCTVLSLPEGCRRLREGSLPARAACVTFDDGYADNYDVAKPILDGLGIPGTFFIAAGAIESGIMWNDLVIEGVRRAEHTLDLSAVDLGTHELEGVDSRRAAVRAVISQIKYLPQDNREAIARRVLESATAETPRLMMTRAKVRGLAEDGHVVGAHTVTHPILAETDDAAARREIESSRDWVADVTGVEPRVFAYPNGRRGQDFDDRHMKMVAAAGFEAAVSTDWGSAHGRSDMLALPRFTPWERERHPFWMRLVKVSARSYFKRQ